MLISITMHSQIQDFLKGCVGGVTGAAGMAASLLPDSILPKGRLHHWSSNWGLSEISELSKNLPLPLLLGSPPFPSVLSGISRLPLPTYHCYCPQLTPETDSRAIPALFQIGCARSGAQVGRVAGRFPLPMPAPRLAGGGKGGGATNHFCCPCSLHSPSGAGQKQFWRSSHSWISQGQWGKQQR